MLLDTGSDGCMFDDRLALLVGVNVYLAGSAGSATGIGGAEAIAVFPIEIEFPSLDGLSWSVFAQFKRLPDGLNGVLGHAGFLGRLTACFSRAETFTLSDMKRGGEHAEPW